MGMLGYYLQKKQIKLKSEFPFAAAFLLAGFSVFLLFQGVFMAREEKREEQKNTGSTVQDKPGPDVELSQTSPVSENTDKTPSVSVSVEQGESKSSEIQQDIKGMETGMQSSTFEVEVPFENRPSDAQQTTAGPDVSGMSQVWDTPVASKHS